MEKSRKGTRGEEKKKRALDSSFNELSFYPCIFFFFFTFLFTQGDICSFSLSHSLNFHFLIYSRRVQHLHKTKCQNMLMVHGEQKWKKKNLLSFSVCVCVKSLVKTNVLIKFHWQKKKSRMKIKSGVVGENRFFSPTVKKFLVTLEDEHCKQQLFKSIKAKWVRAEAAELELLALQ